MYRGSLNRGSTVSLCISHFQQCPLLLLTTHLLTLSVSMGQQEILISTHALRFPNIENGTNITTKFSPIRWLSRSSHRLLCIRISLTAFILPSNNLHTCPSTIICLHLPSMPSFTITCLHLHASSFIFVFPVVLTTS